MADTSITQEHRFHEHTLGKPYEDFPPPRPCPFCDQINFGGIVEIDCGEELADHRFTYHVQCDHCGAEGSVAESPLAAAQAWNQGTRYGKRAEVLDEYMWAAMEAKNLIRCISVAEEYGKELAEDLQPCISTALDGVARMLDLVIRKWDGVELAEECETEEISHG